MIQVKSDAEEIAAFTKALSGAAICGAGRAGQPKAAADSLDKPCVPAIY
jgi:hypothetical protein